MIEQAYEEDNLTLTYEELIKIILSFVEMWD